MRSLLAAIVCLALGTLAGSPLGIRVSHKVSETLQVRLFVAYLSVVLIVMVSHSL